MNTFTQQEINSYRQLFPVCQQWTYLNHAGVAPISSRVAEAVEQFNREALHEGYTAGPHWVRRIEEIRSSCAKLIAAQSSEIAFVRNTSHGLSLIARGLKLKEGDEIILSEVEFPTNVYPWMALEKEGVVLKKIKSLHGELQLDQLESLISPNTRIVSLSSVQYGTGFRLPIREIGKLCRERGIYFFVDAIQSLGAFPIDVEKDHIDFLAADAHKWMLGHEGIGLLYVKKELIPKIEPMLLGWGSVKNRLNFDVIDYQLDDTALRFEEGSHNGLSIYGLGAAIDLLLELGIEKISQRILDLTELLDEGMRDLGFKNGHSLRAKYRSGIVLFCLAEENSENELIKLERKLFSQKIYASIRRGHLRFSPHFYNNEEEIHQVLQACQDFLK